MGRVSTDTIGRHSTDISGRYSGDYRPTLDRHLSTPIGRQLSTAIGRHSCIGRVLTDTIGRHSTDISADTRATIGRHSGDYRPTLDPHLSTPIARQLSTAIGRHSCIGRVSTGSISRHSTDISADTRATIGRHSGDYRPTLDRHLSTPIGRQLLTAIGRHSCIGRALTDTIGQHSTDISADTQASIGRHSGDYRPTLDRHLSTPIARQLSTAIGRHSCIGRVSTGSIGRHSTDISADTRATIGRHSCIGRALTDTIGQHSTDISADTQASIGRLSGDYRPALDRHLSATIGRQLLTAIG